MITSGICARNTSPTPEPGKVKRPFLEPVSHYLDAWYQHDIDIPSYQRGRRIALTLERPHWQTTVWLDAQRIGSQKSLVAPIHMTWAI